MAGIKDTILIVEDGMVEQITHPAAVQKANSGYKTMVVDNLEEAKAAMAKGNVAALITDKAFPPAPGDAPKEDQGVALIEHVRKTLGDKDIPIQLNSSTLTQKNIDDLAMLEGKPAPTLSTTAPMQVGDKTQVVDKSIAITEIQNFIKSELGQPQGQGQALGGITPSGDADGGTPTSGLRRTTDKGGSRGR